jgi:thiamine-monophosphate kinase
VRDLPEEFSRIARHFRPLAGAGALGLADDAAVLTPPPGRELVIAADAMVQGVHFLPDDPPDLVARKLLRTNLSDLAAMGAEPWGYLLTVAVPRATPDAWFAAFAAGLAHDQAEYGVVLLGGDSTSTSGPINLSLTILGTVLPGKALRRHGAQPGDGIFVTGTIGDGALGLLAAKGEIFDPNGFLADRYRLPQPRLELGLRLHGIAHAAMDISDGLIQDLEHLCRASGLGATIHADAVPLSTAARASIAAASHPRGGRISETPFAETTATPTLELCLTGGDDYELLLAVPDAHAPALAETSARSGVPVTRVGRFSPHESKISVVGPNGPIRLDRHGWDHFAAC